MLSKLPRPKMRVSQLTVSSVVLVAPLSHKVSVQVKRCSFHQYTGLRPVDDLNGLKVTLDKLFVADFGELFVLFEDFIRIQFFCVVVFDITVFGEVDS